MYGADAEDLLVLLDHLHVALVVWVEAAPVEQTVAGERKLGSVEREGGRPGRLGQIWRGSRARQRGGSR